MIRSIAVACAVAAVAFVVPGLCHDMHDCPRAKGDAWLRREFDGYLRWARTHNSLLVVTFDESERDGGNHIPTIVLGAHVRPGRYAGRVDHYTVLRTLEDMYGLAPLGVAAERAPITAIWSP